jgi:SNF family Na+-dependent transporter
LCAILIPAALPPRIGVLVFILVWIFFLFFWSIPLVIAESGLGLYTQCGPLEGFAELIQ